MFGVSALWNEASGQKMSSSLRHLLARRSQERENERVTRKSFQCFFVQWANRPDQVNIKTVSTSSFLISVSSCFNFSNYPHLAQKDYDDSVTPTPINHDCISKTVRREILRRLQRSSSFPLKKDQQLKQKERKSRFEVKWFSLARLNRAPLSINRSLDGGIWKVASKDWFIQLGSIKCKYNVIWRHLSQIKRTRFVL